MADLIIIDTDVLIDAGRGVDVAVACLQHVEQQSASGVSIITEMELIVGCRNKAELRTVERFLSRFQVIKVNEAISERREQSSKREADQESVSSFDSPRPPREKSGRPVYSFLPKTETGEPLFDRRVPRFDPKAFAKAKGEGLHSARPSSASVHQRSRVSQSPSTGRGSSHSPSPSSFFGQGEKAKASARAHEKMQQQTRETIRKERQEKMKKDKETDMRRMEREKLRELERLAAEKASKKPSSKNGGSTTRY